VSSCTTNQFPFLNLFRSSLLRRTLLFRHPRVLNSVTICHRTTFYKRRILGRRTSGCNLFSLRILGSALNLRSALQPSGAIFLAQLTLGFRSCPRQLASLLQPALRPFPFCTSYTMVCYIAIFLSHGSILHYFQHYCDVTIGLFIAWAVSMYSCTSTSLSCLAIKTKRQGHSLSTFHHVHTRSS
jgi:hypothetical protein